MGVAVRIEDLTQQRQVLMDVLGPELSDGVFPWGRGGCRMGRYVSQGMAFSAAYARSARELGDQFSALFCECAVRPDQESLFEQHIWSPRGFAINPFAPDKILNHPEQVDAYLRGQNPFPITLEIDPTNRCNNQCPECTFIDKDQKLALSAQQILRVVKELRQLQGANAVTWTGGGEPLLYRELGQVVTAVHRLGAENALITNGRNLRDPVFLRDILPILRWVRISLDAGTAETYARVHGVPARAFDEILDNVRAVIAARQAGEYPVTIGISFLTSTTTVTDMQRTVMLAKGLGVDYIQFKPMQKRTGPWSYRYDNGGLIGQVQEFKKDLQREGTPDFQVFFSKSVFYSGEQWVPTRCHGQQFSTSVAADGKLYVCCHYKGNPDFCLGDLTRQSFEEIWHSERRWQVLRAIDPRKCVPWCKHHQTNVLLEEICRSGKLVRGPVRVSDGGVSYTVQGTDYPPVLHHNFL
jgi:radical SAM protein with 4Fe4S-binding SPASM domain